MRRTWYSSDVDWMRATHAAGTLFGDEAVLACCAAPAARWPSSSAAASSVFRVNIGEHGDLAEPMLIIERNLDTRPLIDLLLDVVGQLYRYHSRLSFREDSVAAGTFAEVRAMTVGFVDLASSTELGSPLFGDRPRPGHQRLQPRVVRPRHASRRADREDDRRRGDVRARSTRLRSPCTALDLVAYCGRHEVFDAARAGVATGDVLEQEGDCYGPVVNRAARFVASAPDGERDADATTVGRSAGELAAVAAHRRRAPRPRHRALVPPQRQLPRAGDRAGGRRGLTGPGGAAHTAGIAFTIRFAALALPPPAAPGSPGLGAVDGDVRFGWPLSCTRCSPPGNAGRSQSGAQSSSMRVTCSTTTGTRSPTVPRTSKRNAPCVPGVERAHAGDLDRLLQRSPLHVGGHVVELELEEVGEEVQRRRPHHLQRDVEQHQRRRSIGPPKPMTSRTTAGWS